MTKIVTVPCRPIGSDGMSRMEREVMALWDSGCSKREIVRRGYKEHYVQTVVGWFAGVEDGKSFAADCKAGTAMLAQRLIELHPARCGAVQ